ncbi:MAG: T9SS type A sorting domain-containing protein [Saprospiraceae bacterium]|nr:T9SS type A sorting domain-containing protein [Candidatus Opimibacter iunctus]
MKAFLSGVFIITYAVQLFSQQTISQIRLLPPGSVVFTSGTIYSNADFGEIRYMQDADAGIAVYASGFSASAVGDSFLVRGVLSLYRGELQISPVLSYSLLGKGKATPAITLDNILDFSAPVYEARKVIIPCAGISSCEDNLSSGWYVLYDQAGNEARLAIFDNPAVVGFPLLNRPVTIEGIWTKFEDQYQLLCQSISDASEGDCHYISPAHLSFSQGLPIVQWSAPPGAKTWLKAETELSITIDYLGTTGGSISWSPDSLEAGHLYNVQLTQEDELGNTYKSVPVLFTPPAVATPIEILFNRKINTSFSDGSAPIAVGSSVIETDLVQRIDQVTSTLDVAMYNTGRASIVQAITRAVQRGVVVRYIADDETSNSALDGQLTFPLIYRSGTGIMHNKFVIADARDPDHAWLWAGSTNLSTNQLSTDPNHAYVIHDHALVLNYLLEFEEMWGQDTGHIDRRYGDFKTNNTAHLFQVGDVGIESYFSPSDEANCRIIESLRSADHQLLIGLLLLTRDDLVDEIIAAYDRGVEVRVILNDESSSSDALAQLKQNGIPVVTHDPSPIFDHKYAIIDEGFPDSDPQVISGSHNWTWSADNINDENMLIFHDQSITNIFRQEYEARWEELNSTAVLNEPMPGLSYYPNPASSFIHITNPSTLSCHVELINMQGQRLANTTLTGLQDGTLMISQNIPDGVYALSFNWPDHQLTRRISVLK